MSDGRRENLCIRLSNDHELLHALDAFFSLYATEVGAKSLHLCTDTVE